MGGPAGLSAGLALDRDDVYLRDVRFGQRWLLMVLAGAWVTLGAPRGLRADVQAANVPPTEQLVPPKLETSPEVPYPPDAQGEAAVTLTIGVTAEGGVEQVTALPAEGPFAIAAVRAAWAFRFRPATRAGKPIRSRTRVVIAFAPPPPDPVPAPAGPEGTSADGATASPQSVPRATKVEVVEVVGAKAEAGRSASFTRAEVRQIPGTFGDPFRAVEIMPGVTPIVSGLPFFFVRGAPPGNVGYFLDGVRVPYLFHVGAGPSVVHPGLMDRVDLYPGGYPSRYGRFSGGIVSGETLGPRPEPHGEYNLRLFDAGVLASGPFANGRGNVSLGGRYSYTAAVLSLLSPDVILDYWDYQARASYELSDRDTLSVFGFGALDYLGQRTATETLTLFGTEFHRIDLRHDHRLGNDGNLRTALMLGIDRTRLPQERFLRDRVAGLRNELNYRLGRSAQLRVGTDVQIDAYDIELNSQDQSPANARIASAFPSRTDLVTGVRGDLVLDVTRDVQITPGVRFDLFSSDGAAEVAADPRVASRVRIAKGTSVLSALGIAHQAPAFVIPVPGFQPGGLRGGLQRAVQESLGLEWELGESTTATATVFHNGFFNLSDALSVTPPTISGCAPGTFPAGSIAGDRLTQPTGNAGTCGIPRFVPGTIGSDRSGGGGQASHSANDARNSAAFEARARGSAYGLEVFLKRKMTSRIGGFVSYTLSRSTRSTGNQAFIASFDRTHVLNTALAFDLGRNWRAGSRVTFYTGLPKAQDPTDPGATRLSPFVRLDLRLEKRWEMGRGFWVSFVEEWMNATLSKESVGTNCTLNGCQETKAGPITIPSIGVEGGF
jgi:hypothetical protein